jgi:hypothetical protein
VSSAKRAEKKDKLGNGKRALLTEMLAVLVFLHADEGKDALEVGNDAWGPLNPPSRGERRERRVSLNSEEESFTF